MPFCDFACGGVSTVSWGGSVAGAMAGQTAVNGSLLAAYQQELALINMLNVEVTAAEYVKGYRLTTTTDAHSKAITASIEQQLKARNDISQSIIEGMKKLYQDHAVLEDIQYRQEIYGEQGISYSFDTYAEVSPLFKKHEANRALYVKQKASEQERIEEKKERGDINNRALVFLRSIEGKASPDNIFQKKSLTNEEAVHIHDVVMINLWKSGYKEMDEVKKAKAEVVIAVLSDVIYDRLSLYDAPISTPLVNLSSSSYSINELISSMVQSRSTNPHWFENILELNTYGLDREMVVLKAEEILLLERINRAKQASNIMNAIM